MRNDIQPQLQTISQYFERIEFYVPSYQRPYAWQLAQCDQLMEDIKQHLEDFAPGVQDNYFFGTVLIAQEAGEEHEVVLIDGQQRTTTFFLLLKACLLRVDEQLLVHQGKDDESRQFWRKLHRLKEKLVRMLYRLSDEAFDDYIDQAYVLTPDNLKYLNDSVSQNKEHLADMQTILLGNRFEDIIPYRIPRRQKDNAYTNFYKNFRYFYKACGQFSVVNFLNFTNHLIDKCQMITITSYNTDQAINIFNSLNGTGLPLTPIEVLVSKTIARSADRKQFERNWEELIKLADASTVLDLNTLLTHYIFMQLAEKAGPETRNPGISAFFKKYSDLLRDDVQFTADLKKILDTFENFSLTPLGQLLNRLNSNLKPFVSSYLFFRSDESYLEELVRFGILLELSQLSYSHSDFKGFLEKMNLLYSQIDRVSTEDLVASMKQQLSKIADRETVQAVLQDSGLSSALVYVNEYLFAREKGVTVDLTGKVDIEHIIPKSGLNRDNIRQAAGFESPEEFQDYLEKLGNKILLESGINRRISDAWFVTKKNYRQETGEGYLGTRFPLAQSLSQYAKDTWTKEDIERATAKASERIVGFIFED